MPKALDSAKNCQNELGTPESLESKVESKSLQSQAPESKSPESKKAESQPLESQIYFEVTIIPSDCFEIFTDFALESTGQALEEIPTSKLKMPNFTNTGFANAGDKASKDKAFDDKALDDKSLQFFNTTKELIKSAPNAMRLYLVENPAPFIKSLESFSLTLSHRLEKPIGFAYACEMKHNQDWIEQYKASITPLICAPFYIRPSWCAPSALDSSDAESTLAKTPLQDIIIDPALAFGSGHHASTFSCIELLREMDLSGKACLDVGCGSGILSIIMAKLGGVVDACDVDALAVQESIKNAALNNVRFQHIWEGSLHNIPESSDAPESKRPAESNSSKIDSSDAKSSTKIDSRPESNNTKSSKQNSNKSNSARYDVICANIIADVLAYLCKDFRHALKSGGVLILSGIIEEKSAWLKEIFSDFTLLEEKHLDEWVSLKFALIE